MRKAPAMLAIAALLGAVGCGRPVLPNTGKGGNQFDSHQINAQSVFGTSNVTVTPNLCAGRATLQQGSATVTDSCFTGDTNIVLCTDVTGLNPVRCTPQRGSLQIFGIGADVISYARVK